MQMTHLMTALPGASSGVDARQGFGVGVIVPSKTRTDANPTNRWPRVPQGASL